MPARDRHPDRVKGLVLISPSVPSSSVREWEGELLQKQERAEEVFFERPEVRGHREGGAQPVD